MKSAPFIRSASAVAIVSLFAGCSTLDNMFKPSQSTTVGAAPGTIVVAEPAGTTHTSASAGSIAVAEPAGTTHTSMATGTTNEATARNTTNLGNNDTGTVATNPTYGGGTPKSAITAGELAAQNQVAMNAPPSRPAATAAQSAPTTSIQPSRSPQTVSDVRSAQQALKDDGYNVGPVDGKMGPKTAAALRKFQKDHGIQATGRLDSRTLAALGSASGSTS